MTKLLNLVLAIHDHLGLGRGDDTDLSEMRRRTDIRTVLDAIDRREREVDPDGARGPDSAADTEA